MVPIMRTLSNTSIIRQVMKLIAAIITMIVMSTWPQQKTGFVHLDEDAYYMDTAIVKVSWTQMMLVIGGTLLLSVVVLLIPSLLVKKIHPIKAMRFS